GFARYFWRSHSISLVLPFLLASRSVYCWLASPILSAWSGDSRTLFEPRNSGRLNVTSAAATMSPTVRIEIIGDRDGKIDLLSIDVEGNRGACARERQPDGTSCWRKTPEQLTIASQRGPARAPAL